MNSSNRHLKLRHKKSLSLLLVSILMILAACERNLLEPAAIVVEGEVGVRPQVQFSAPVEITETTSQILVEGEGHELEDHDPALLRYVAFDAESGDVIEDSYARTPILVGVSEDDAGSLYPHLAGTPEGSRILLEELGTAEDPRTKVIVVDVLHTRAHGTPVEALQGEVDLEIAEDGTPSITDVSPELVDIQELAVIPTIRGSGAQIREGDAVTVRYLVVDGATGEEAESTWGPHSVPTTTPFTGLIPGWQQGLIDTTVGSQVILIVPPELAYGTSVMVFVVDVLAVTSGGN